MKKSKKINKQKSFVVASGLIAGGTSLLFSCKDKSENLVSTEIKKEKCF